MITVLTAYQDLFTGCVDRIRTALSVDEAAAEIAQAGIDLGPAVGAMADPGLRRFR